MNTRGFTLLELIVVIALIGITTGFVLPRISSVSLTGSHLQQNARQSSLFIEQAARYAVRTAQPLRLGYSSAENTLFLAPLAKESDEGESEKLFSSPLKGSVVVKDFQSYYRGVLSAGSMYLNLDEKGYLEPACIHLQAGNGDQMTLHLSPFLGKVAMSSGYADVDEVFFH